jgi:hypothetical protein
MSSDARQATIDVIDVVDGTNYRCALGVCDSPAVCVAMSGHPPVRMRRKNWPHPPAAFFVSELRLSGVRQAPQKRYLRAGQIVSAGPHATGGERIPEVCHIRCSGGRFLGSNAFLPLSHVAMQLGDDPLDSAFLAIQVDARRRVAAPTSPMYGQTCIKAELLRLGLLRVGT